MPLTSIKDANIQHPVKAQTWSSSSFCPLNVWSIYPNCHLSTSLCFHCHFSNPVRPSSQPSKRSLNIFFNCYTTAWGKFCKQKATRWLPCTNPPQCLSVSLGKVQFLKRVYKTLVSGLLAYNLASPHSSHLQPYLTSSGPRIQYSSSGETLFLPPSSGQLLIVQTPWHAQENLPSLPRLGYLSYLFSVLSLPFYNTFMTFPLSDLIAIWRWEESYFSCWYSKMADTEQI